MKKFTRKGCTVYWQVGNKVKVYTKCHTEKDAQYMCDKNNEELGEIRRKVHNINNKNPDTKNDNSHYKLSLKKT